MTEPSSPPLERHQHQRFLRHEAEHGRQGGDQRAGAIECKVRSLLGHDPTLSTATVRTVAQRRTALQTSRLWMNSLRLWALVGLSLMGSMREYDLVVIGSGPGGQKAAIAAAKLGKSVAVIERGRMLGGVCVNTGTIPSKTLREAVLYLTGMSQRELYGASYRVKDKITPADLLARTQHVIGKQVDVVRNQLMRNRIDLLDGPRPVPRRAHRSGRRPRRAANGSRVSGDYVVIATGTKPARPAGVEFDEKRVLDSDGILDLKSIPASMVVVGAGRHRHRVRVDVRRAGHQGHRRGKAAGHAGLLRPRDRRGAALPPARPGGHLPLRRGGDRRRRRRRRAPSPPWPAASRSPPRR